MGNIRFEENFFTLGALFFFPNYTRCKSSLQILLQGKIDLRLVHCPIVPSRIGSDHCQRLQSCNHVK
eukprot:337906-Amphidinium_carterae.1